MKFGFVNTDIVYKCLIRVWSHTLGNGLLCMSECGCTAQNKTHFVTFAASLVRSLFGLRLADLLCLTLPRTAQMNPLFSTCTALNGRHIYRVDGEEQLRADESRVKCAFTFGRKKKKILFEQQRLWDIKLCNCLFESLGGFSCLSAQPANSESICQSRSLTEFLWSQLLYQLINRPDPSPTSASPS